MCAVQISHTTARSGSFMLQKQALLQATCLDRKMPVEQAKGDAALQEMEDSASNGTVSLDSSLGSLAGGVLALLALLAFAL